MELCDGSFYMPSWRGQRQLYGSFNLFNLGFEENSQGPENVDKNGSSLR